MFQFSGFPPAGYVFTTRCQPFRWRVSPFGHQRFFACTRLPAAFRSVPRPSSALDAQASPVRLLWLGLSCGDRACSWHFYPKAISDRTVCLPVRWVIEQTLCLSSLTDKQRAFSYSVVKVLTTGCPGCRAVYAVGGNCFWQLLGSFCFAETSTFAPFSAVCETNCQATGNPGCQWA
jgi:hypothetical protein